MKRNITVILIGAIAAMGWFLFSAGSNPFTEVGLENKSGTKIDSIQVQGQFAKRKGDGFQKMEIAPKYDDQYKFKVSIKFADGSELQTTEHANPGEKVTIIIYKKDINVAVKKAAQW